MNSIKFIFTAIVLISAFILLSCTSSSEEINSGLPLEKTKWILTVLNSKKIFTPESGKDIYVTFSSDKNINGFGGCNNFSGGFTLTKDKLKTGMIAATEMFCESRMDTESEFLKTLQKSERYNINGNILQIYDSTKLIMKFKGVKASSNK
jgi:heat shock protein HslJ